MGIERVSEFWPSWKTLELLGRGGNGEVYKCIHEEMGVKTYSAIKVINISSRQMSTFTFDTGEIRSFCRNLITDCVNEVNVMLSLKNCPNIVGIEDFKVVEIVKDEEWEIFIRMELLTCLTDYLRDRVLTQAEVIKLGVDLCTALELCHSKNIMHRDIKPANIFVNEFGVFKLGDFGIARTLEAATAGFSHKGTLTYVAPEVMYSNNYTKAVDIYSLGLVLYQLANNNRLPFVSATDDYTNLLQNDAVKNRLRGDTLPPACNADEALNSIFRIACEFKPENRFQSAGQMKEAMCRLSDFYKPNNTDARYSTVVTTQKTAKLGNDSDVTAPIDFNVLPAQSKNKNAVVIAVIAVVMAVLIATVILIIMFASGRTASFNDNNNFIFSQTTDEYNSHPTEENSTEQKKDNSVQYLYYVSSATPDNAGVVVRSESTYYSDKIAVLSEGTLVRVVSGFAQGTEYIKIAFETDGTEKSGWVLGKYILDKNGIPYDGHYNRAVAFEQKKVNVYVSNITESGIGEFVGTPSVSEILKFAINHSILNYNPSVSGIENGIYDLGGNFYEVRIDADYADRLSVRFFGADINTADIDRTDVRDGYLYGYSTSVFSTGVAFVKGVYSDLSAEKYKIYFTVYQTGDYDESDYYAYTPAQAEFFNNFVYSYDGYVILQKYISSGEELYKIIEFKKGM